jgi:hypothetical protein
MDILSSAENVRTLKWTAYEDHLTKFNPVNDPSLFFHYYYGMAAQFPDLASSIFRPDYPA